MVLPHAECILRIPDYDADGLPMGLELVVAAPTSVDSGLASIVQHYKCKTGFTGAATSATCSAGILSVRANCTEGMDHLDVCGQQQVSPVHIS